MPDFPHQKRVAVVVPIGYSDQSSVTAVISIAQAVPNLCVDRKFFIKHQSIEIQFVVQQKICPGVTFELSTDNLVEVLEEHLSQLVGRFVPPKVICALN